LFERFCIGFIIVDILGLGERPDQYFESQFESPVPTKISTCPCVPLTLADESPTILGGRDALLERAMRHFPQSTEGSWND